MLREYMAEPGGYLQWNDVDIEAQRLVNVSETSQSATKPTLDMMALMSKPRESSAFKYVQQSLLLPQRLSCLSLSCGNSPPQLCQ